jgi:hypothetical protein
MYRLLQDRHTFEMFMESLGCGENDTCITQVMGVLAQQTLRECHSFPLALDILVNGVEDAHTVHTLRIYLQMMITASSLQPHLYDVVYQLVHDVPIGKIYEAYPSVCPDILRQWHTLMLQENTETTLMERAHSYREISQTLREDICYPYLRDRIEHDMTTIQDVLCNELYMSYHILDDTDVHEILVLLDIPVSIQAIIQECRLNADVPTSDDCLYVFVCVSLLVLVGIYCFYHFKRRSHLHH